MQRADNAAVEGARSIEIEDMEGESRFWKVEPLRADVVQAEIRLQTSPAEEEMDKEKAMVFDDASGEWVSPATTPAPKEEGSSIASRAITVPREVSHRYILLPKTDANDADTILSAIAHSALNILQPKRAIIFICGGFGRSKAPPKQTAINTAQKKKGKKKNTKKLFGANGKRVDEAGLYKTPATSQVNQPSPLSAREACAKLQSMGLDAVPLHTAMGFESSSAQTDDSPSTITPSELPPYLVTFEGAARGLHVDAVDAVYLVGKPSSAGAYLHLAGRVGRHSVAMGTTVTGNEDNSNGTGGVVSGTVVSVCSKGSVDELRKWTNSIGGGDDFGPLTKKDAADANIEEVENVGTT